MRQDVNPPAPVLANDGPRSATEVERKYLKQHWVDFCNADLVPENFAEDMERAGLIELRAVRRADLDTPFASERGINRGGSIWDLTAAGRSAILDSSNDGPRSGEGE